MREAAELEALPVVRRSKKLGDVGDGFDDFYGWQPSYEAPYTAPDQIYSDLPLADAASEDSGLLAGALQRLRDAQARFDNAYFLLQQQGPSVAQSGDADALIEWQSLISHADNVRAGLQAIADGSAQALDTAKQIFGLSAIRSVARSRLRNVRGVRGRGMGALPLLGVAAVGAAIAIVIAAANSMMQFVVNWRRVDAGLKPVPTSGGVAEGIANAATLVKWGALGLAVYFVGPELLKMAKK